MKPQHRTRRILQSGLDPSQRLILVAIADHMEDTAEGEDRNSRPSVALLCEETGLGERAVQNHLKALISSGVLSRHTWSSQHPPYYMIHWGRLAESTPEKTAPARKICAPSQDLHPPAKSAPPRKDCAPPPAESAGGPPAKSAPEVDHTQGTIKGTTHTEREPGVCVSSPESEGSPEPEPKGPTPLDLVRDWHTLVGRQCPKNPPGLDLAGEILAEHGDRASEVILLATRKLQATKMLPNTASFGGLRTVLPMVVLPRAAPKQAPAPEPPPETVDALAEHDRAEAELEWRRELEGRIGAQNMEIWFTQVRVALVSPQIVRLEMESRYYLDWIEGNLGRELESAWEAVLGVRPGVVMEVAPARPVLRMLRREDPDPAPEPPRAFPSPATDSRAAQIC